MKVGGFSFVRNALKYDYPVAESLRSLLPLCDEVVVAVGRSEDGTLDLVRSIGDPKLRVLETTWDESLREGGRVLADETNKALDALSPDCDWAFYLQADEVLHETGQGNLHRAMAEWLPDKQVEGLLLPYRHFYGSYSYVGDSRRWYRREVRVIRNDRSIRSYKDAQGFRKDGRKLRVKPVEAFVHHYGWVKPPKVQQAKQETFNKLWHDDGWVKRNVVAATEFDYSGVDSITRFEGEHPAVMRERVARQDWELGFDPSLKRFRLKDRIYHWIEARTGWRPFEYRNYRII